MRYNAGKRKKSTGVLDTVVLYYLNDCEHGCRVQLFVKEVQLRRNYTMSVQVEKLEKNMAKLTIEVSAEEFDAATGAGLSEG